VSLDSNQVSIKAGSKVEGIAEKLKHLLSAFWLTASRIIPLKQPCQIRFDKKRNIHLHCS